MDSLNIAVKHYYWKPGKAFFHCFELEEYAQADISLKHPIMDLGCGDGTFATMLQEKGVLDSIDVALDYAALGHLKSSVRYGAIQADARALPLRSGVLASVLANGVLCSIDVRLDQAISEVHRVLTDQGLFVLTVPTPQVNQTQLIPRLLNKAGIPWLAAQYLLKLNRRLTLYHMLSEESWQEKLEGASFHIEQVRYYFTPRQAFWPNFFTLQIFRIFAFLKVVRVRWLLQQVAYIQEKLLRPVFMQEQSLTQEQKRDRAGWLLIIARKTTTPLEQ